jgi:hypothetical protein
MRVQAEKLVDLWNRCGSRKVNGLENAAHVQEAVVGPGAVNVKSGGVESVVVVDANDLSLDRTWESALVPTTIRGFDPPPGGVTAI